MKKLNINLPNVIEESIEVETSRENTKKRKKKVTFDNKVDDWTLQTFAKYFEYLYQFKFKAPYLPKKGDLKQLKRVLAVKEKETIKRYMNEFMELDFFETKTLRIFCSNYSQTVLDNYTDSGKLPNNTKKSISNEPEQPNEWVNEVDNIFGGDK